MATKTKSRKKKPAAKSSRPAAIAKTSVSKKSSQKARSVAVARPARVKPNPELSQSVLVLTFIFTLLCVIFMAVAFYSYN